MEKSLFYNKIFGVVTTTISLIILRCHLAGTSQTQTPYATIGIFYNCPPPQAANAREAETANKIIEFNRIAQNSNETVSELMDKYLYHVEIDYSTQEWGWLPPQTTETTTTTTQSPKLPNYKYHSFAVCHHEEFLELVTKIFLQKEYSIPRRNNGNNHETTDNTDKNNGNNGNENNLNETGTINKNTSSDENRIVYEENILVLFAYVPESMSAALSEIFSFTDFPRLCAPKSCDNRFPLFDIAKYATFLYQHFERLQWYDVTLISVVEKGLLHPYHKYYEHSYALLNTTGRYCLKGRTFQAVVSGEEGKQRKTRLSDEDFANRSRGAIVIFAGEAFLNWFLDELEKSPLFNNDNNNNNNSNKNNNDADNDNNNNKNKNNNNDDEDNDDNNNNNSNKNDRNNKNIPLVTHDTGNAEGIMWMNLESEERLKFYEALTDHPRVDNNSDINGNINIQRDYGGNILINVGGYFGLVRDKQTVWQRSFRVYDEMKVNFRPGLGYDSLHPIRCTADETTCPPGSFKTYGNDIPGGSSLYDIAHSRRCQLCPDGHIKVSPGDSGCVPCPTVTVSDDLRTICIDPYTYIAHEMSTLEFVLAAVFVLLGGLFSTFGFFVFVVKRDTPVVRSSDIALSLLHLFALFSVFGLSSVLYTTTSANVSKGHCIARNVVISVFYTLNVALVYTKTEKILAAFLSSVRVTSGEMKRAAAFQALAIVVFLSITNGLLLTMYKQREPGLAYKIESKDFKDSKDQASTMVKIVYRNTAFHTDALFVVLIGFQLVCLAQAFRGRNLPSPMNDAMSVVYAILITTLVFAVYFPISYFQSTADKESIQLVVTLINCCVYLVFLYGRKLYVVVLRAEKNTRAYFQQECFAEMSSHVQANIRHVEGASHG